MPMITPQPVIGIITKSDSFEENHKLPRYSVLKQYVTALSRFGAAVMLIPPQDSASLKTCFKRLNGLLLAGGSDLGLTVEDASSCYDKNFDIERDRAEIQITKMALEKDIPVLGICRGMQLLNVVKGGSICQDIESSFPDALRHTSDWWSKERVFHPVDILPGTILSSLTNTNRTMVNGNHHQCVNLLGDDIVPSAVAPDGVVEAIECSPKHYVLGIQWHPEWLLEDGEKLSMEIFSSFVTAAGRQCDE